MSRTNLLCPGLSPMTAWSPSRGLDVRFTLDSWLTSVRGPLDVMALRFLPIPNGVEELICDRLRAGGGIVSACPHR
jgi:hypothetical protein